MTHRKNTKDMKQVSKIWTSFNSLQCACFTQIKWRNRRVENLTFFFCFFFTSPSRTRQNIQAVSAEAPGSQSHDRPQDTV